LGENVPDGAGQVHAEQGGLTAVAVLPRSGQDGHGNQQAGGVGADESLTSVDRLPAS
jgi:hypothetical protein